MCTGVAEEALPSVRQLAAELRVNPNTVQQAYRELEREGLAFVRRGQGTFIAEAKGASAKARNASAALVAARALREAHLHGLDADELIDAIRKAANAAEKRGSR